MTVSDKKKVIIIGSGVGGTALAARLSRQGFDVHVYEKNGFSGGRLSLIHKNGHRFDQGPSLYLMPKLFEETFNDLDEEISNHLELLKCENNYTIRFEDGDKFVLSCDMAKLLDQVKKYEGADETTVLKFMDYMKEIHIHYERSVDIALKNNYEKWYHEFQLKNAPSALYLHLLGTVYSRVKKYFKTDKMRQAFTFQTMYIGMSPYDTPAIFSLLQYTELAEGVWYPRGGFHKVIEALEKIATKKYSAKFHYNVDIEKIIVNKHNVATGVRFTDGHEEFADIVVCNADLVYAYNHLLPQTKYGMKLGEKAALTSSSISFYWGMKRKIPELDVHNVFLSKDYKASFDDVFERQILSDDPFFYVNVPSRLDSTAAPDDKETIVVLLPITHITQSNQYSFDEMVKKAREQIIRIIEKRLNIEKFDSLIETEEINDPRVWQKKFNLWKGSILGMAHGIPQVLHFRPKTRCKEFKNLYFVGASAHPGTGVPIVLCGAKLVEQQILRDYGYIRKDNDDLIILSQFAVLGLVFIILFYFLFVFWL